MVLVLFYFADLTLTSQLRPRPLRCLWT